MKLESVMTRFAPSEGYICDVGKERKATSEVYEYFGISPGYFLCISEGKAYTISEYMQKISCSCADMTHRCKGKEVCKHLIRFMMLENPHDLPEIREDMAQLLIAAGWSGTPLTPPDRPENRKHKPKLPNIHDPDRKPVPQAAKRENSKKSYEGKTAEEIVRAMDDKELESNARKGGVMAKAEWARREAEREESA
jgi:predicted house-cleaning noncanonical NTP pyrophosphatase (MazG superfamily)